MTRPLRNIWPRLVIVEGIMGSGKSTAVLRLAERLEAAGISALAITEGVNPHPIRFDWNVPWVDMPAAQLAGSAAAKWRRYVDGAAPSGTVSVVDGQLFHGNLTSLFLLEADLDLMRDYMRDVVAAIRPLAPLLIYFHQDDINRAIRAIAAERGDRWVQNQLAWKLGSPYAVRHGLIGLAGLVALYHDYRALTDRLFADLDIPKISIENSRQDWVKYDETIDRVLTNANAFAANLPLE